MPPDWMMIASSINITKERRNPLIKPFSIPPDRTPITKGAASIRISWEPVRSR